MKRRKNSTNRHKCLTIFGITIGIFGIILLLLKIWIMDILITSLLVLKPNSLIENVWHKVPDVRTDFYIFNWTNPEDFHNLTIKPKFQELGPYIFSQTLEKMDVIWNKNNTVTYSQQRMYYLDERSFKTNFSEEITTVNLISLCVSHLIRNDNYLVKKFASIYFSTAAPFVHLTATLKQAFFDGLDNLVVELGNYFPLVFADMPRFHNINIFSFSNQSNYFEGVLNMEKGVNGNYDVHEWNFYNTSPYYEASCAKVHGSAGELYSRQLIKKTYIEIFAPVICRYVKLDFEEEVIINGIMGYKYSVGDSLFDNGTRIPGNECYCGDDCIPSGVVSTSSCRYGLPLFLSLPHFYGADPIYLNAVQNLQPRRDKHESYIIIEPTTGILLNAKIRIQVNFRIHPIKDITVYANVRDMIFPTLWMDQTADLPKNIFLLLKVCLMLPHLLTIIGSIFLTLGVVLPFSPKFISWFKKLSEQKQSISTIQEGIPLNSCDKIVKISNTSNKFYK